MRIIFALHVIGEAAAVEVAAVEVVRNSTTSVHATHTSKLVMQLQLMNLQEKLWNVSHQSTETTDM